MLKKKKHGGGVDEYELRVLILSTDNQGEEG